MASRSRNSHGGAVSSGKTSMICCAGHAAVGCSVIVSWTIRRRWVGEEHEQYAAGESRTGEEVHRHPATPRDWSGKFVTSVKVDDGVAARAARRSAPTPRCPAWPVPRGSERLPRGLFAAPIVSEWPQPCSGGSDLLALIVGSNGDGAIGDANARNGVRLHDD
jgi:hypothetical protein